MEIRKVDKTELVSVLDLIDEYDRVPSPRPADEELPRAFGSILHSGDAPLVPSLMMAWWVPVP
ncbi:hypothetical protein AAG587_10065 [Vreelandella neptunia]|uniref:hypothetical protein n=1 Tax=Vreelandella neptunia TaxID=115551 RepID=UPI00315A0FBE